MAEAMILNNNAQEYTLNYIHGLFKPNHNPKHDDVDYTNLHSIPTTNHYGLHSYPKTLKNDYTTIYNTKNVVGGMFLVSQNFLDFINQMNQIWEQDNTPRRLTEVTYVNDPVTGGLIIDTVNNPPVTHEALVDLYSGPNGNNAEKMKAFEKGLCQAGVESINAGVVSQSAQELFLRHLFSVDPLKRKVAFDVAENYYGLAKATCDAAQREIIAALDYNSDNLNIVRTDNVINFQYNQPIAFERKYTATIDNPTAKELYLYFPTFSIGAMDEEFVGVWLGLSNPDGTTTNYINDHKLGQLAYRVKGSYTAKGKFVPNHDVPSLTNFIWSVDRQKKVPQASYVALHLSLAGNGGDIICDHLDQITHMDNMEFEIGLHSAIS